MADAQQTVERMQLGLVLQELRSRSGRSQQEAGQAIGRAYVRISQVEHGKGALKQEELVVLLDLYGASRAERETVLALGVQARRRAPRRAYTDVLPDAFQRLADLQANASRIRHYTSGVFPGLLQSAEYVEAVIRACDGVWWDAASGQAETRIAFRLDQQRRALAAQPKSMSFVFTEDALRTVVGSGSVMRSQILHVLQLAERHPSTSVQILRSTTVGNPALGGSLIVLDFSNAPRIGYAPTLYGPTTYYDQPADTTAMACAFDRASELALSPAESRALLIESLKEF
ncbi:transcriptional regulator with XRE-family HTH domain [Saccharothrix coeruleofusca]|uniref:helix-turn-helix domain-containing protein n=1 Tax=Saccharothrix coeruleofusca TaxID=33919 RepID=UPI001AE8859D|nr:helix-turn-helix transcriptional regulator [Saccharothrix coeruleofusca]MBP2337132.1 transcriptional regulator with XRE-family HTH domain [Saccharothrix coeruleofusca]